MPNAPAMVHSGFTTFTPGASATPTDCALVRTLFLGVGMCEEVTESQLDIGCGLSGAGPAYVSFDTIFMLIICM